MPLPDAADRRAILRIHLGSRSTDKSPALDEIAQALTKLTEGFSGAWLHHVCQEAKRLALRGTRSESSTRLTTEHALETLEAEIMEHQGAAGG